MQFLSGKEQKIEQTPTYLYKIITEEQWVNAQTADCVPLSSEDHLFIHLSKENQLDRIIEKYWSDVPHFVILKLDVGKLPGNLIYETNPEGKNRYYHLYNGFIPLNAVSEAINYGL